MIGSGFIFLLKTFTTPIMRPIMVSILETYIRRELKGRRLDPKRREIETIIKIIP
jgi:hypothetical protein